MNSLIFETPKPSQLELPISGHKVDDFFLNFDSLEYVWTPVF